MFPKNSASLSNCAILKCRRHFRPFGINAAHFPESSSRIFENVAAKWTFSVQQFFSAKNYLQSSHYKNYESNHCFFLFSLFVPPRSFFFSFPFLRQVGFKKSTRYTNISKILLVFITTQAKISRGVTSQFSIFFIVLSFGTFLI